MEDTTKTQTPPTTPAANSTIKMTGGQCREMAEKFWTWTGLLPVPAVAILSYRGINNELATATITILRHGNLGRVSSVGTQVVVELIGQEEPTLSYKFFEFTQARAAQSFAKRLRRGKHQIIIAGLDCLRVVKVSINPERHTVTEHDKANPGLIEKVEAATRNLVSHIGQEMTNGEVSRYESLPCESYDVLLDDLKTSYRRAAREARPTPAINQTVTESEPLQTGVVARG